jgi:hypothetical protein
VLVEQTNEDQNNTREYPLRHFIKARTRQIALDGEGYAMPTLCRRVAAIACTDTAASIRFLAFARLPLLDSAALPLPPLSYGPQPVRVARRVRDPLHPASPIVLANGEKRCVR